MSTTSVEARLTNLEVQLATLTDSSQQQAALLERQSKLLESILGSLQRENSGKTQTTAGA